MKKTKKNIVEKQKKQKKTKKNKKKQKKQKKTRINKNKQKKKKWKDQSTFSFPAQAYGERKAPQKTICK